MWRSPPHSPSTDWAFCHNDCHLARPLSKFTLCVLDDPLQALAEPLRTDSHERVDHRTQPEPTRKTRRRSRVVLLYVVDILQFILQFSLFLFGLGLLVANKQGHRAFNRCGRILGHPHPHLSFHCWSGLRELICIGPPQRPLEKSSEYNPSEAALGLRSLGCYISTITIADEMSVLTGWVSTFLT